MLLTTCPSRIPGRFHARFFFRFSRGLHFFRAGNELRIVAVQRMQFLDPGHVLEIVGADELADFIFPPQFGVAGLQTVGLRIGIPMAGEFQTKAVGNRFARLWSGGVGMAFKGRSAPAAI